MSILVEDPLAVNPHLPQPYDTWPAWAVNFDIDIADRIGGILGGDFLEGVDVWRARLWELEWVRDALARRMAVAYPPV
jgi:hypothetical protein